jgi:hypothetical protein
VAAKKPADVMAKNIAEAIWLRTVRRLTCAQIAEKLKVSKDDVGLWLREAKVMKPEAVEKPKFIDREWALDRYLASKPGTKEAVDLLGALL